MEKEKTPVNKRNLTMMIILAILFIIGIMTRWEYISVELKDTFGEYFTPVDTTKIR